MVYRENPKCDLCGEDIPGVYNDNPDLIGDTFSHWDFIGHNKVCKEAKLIAPQQPQSIQVSQLEPPEPVAFQQPQADKKNYKYENRN